MVQSALYFAGLSIVHVLQQIPLCWVARLGRFGGLVGWSVASRRRRLAFENIQQCVGTEKSPAEIRDMVRENFCRLGESFLCSVATAAMGRDRLEQCLEVVGLEKFDQTDTRTPTSCVLALGHFGNFELFGHLPKFLPAWRGVTSYRSLKPQCLDQLVLRLRRSTGSLYFERRKEAAMFSAAAQQGQSLVGLLADQSVGNGLQLPFLGRVCATTRAPALFALRYRMRLLPVFCYRTGLARWRIEIGDEIPTVHDGKRRVVEEIMRDVNGALEVAVRRDPVNWYWIHQRWKDA